MRWMRIRCVKPLVVIRPGRRPLIKVFKENSSAVFNALIYHSGCPYRTTHLRACAKS